MIIKQLANFDLKQICDSGQCFRIYQDDNNPNHFSVIASDHYLTLSQEGETVFFDCSEEEFTSFWSHYFDLETDYQSIMDRADPNDEYLKKTLHFGSGIRILNQDLWEVIIFFLISQQNNITRIRRCIDNLCKRYGEKKILSNHTSIYSFPTPEALSRATEEELKECNLGYRAKYIQKTAKDISSEKISLEKIKKMDYKNAREELLKLYGVGVKVADCICLFALHHLEAFPVDTHIKQAMEKYYKNKFPTEKYADIQGVLQQYIFYWELKH